MIGRLFVWLAFVGVVGSIIGWIWTGDPRWIYTGIVLGLTWLLFVFANA